MVVCGICHEEDLTEVGELDSCDHSFCFECIQHWAQIESRCPFCKARFTTISHKKLDIASLPDAEQSDGNVRQRFVGAVVQTLQVPERNQVYLGDEDWAGDEGEDPLGNVMCMECGRGDDEDNLMLCDGCERACHTCCANLDALPEGDWFCWVCQENRHVDSEGNSTPAATTDRPSTRLDYTRLRSSLVASDFILPRSRRRAASPGARSELARPGRRVRRRLVRSGQEPYGRSQSRDQRQASDADMILNALERSISSRDHSGLSTTNEHRRLAGLRGTWNSVRQGRRPFPQPSHTVGPPLQIPSEVPRDNSAESTAWAAFEQSRRSQDRAARQAARFGQAEPSIRAEASRAAPRSPPAHAGSPPIRRQETASSLARQAVAEARSRGRQLGPTGMPLLTHHHRQPSARAVSGGRPYSPVHKSTQSKHIRTTSISEQLASATHSQRAMSPPVREDVAAERGYEPGRQNRRPERLGESPRQSSPQPLRPRQHNCSQLATAGFQYRPQEVQNAVDSTHPYPPARHPEPNPNLLPVQLRSFAQSCMPSDPRSAPHTESTITESGRLDRPQTLLTREHSRHQQQLQQYHHGQAQPQQHSSYERLYSVPRQPLQHAAASHTWAAPVGTAHAEPAAAASSLPHGQALAVQHDSSTGRHALGKQPPAEALPQANEGWRSTSNGNDSSESSSSQMVHQQQPGGPCSTANHEYARSQAKARHAVLHKQGQADKLQQTSAKLPAVASGPVLSKQQAADAVRAVLKPLYASKLVSKDQFKAVAQSATHVLVDQAVAGKDVKQIVQACLAAVGLDDIVAQAL